MSKYWFGCLQSADVVHWGCLFLEKSPKFLDDPSLVKKKQDVYCKTPSFFWPVNKMTRDYTRRFNSTALSTIVSVHICQSLLGEPTKWRSQTIGIQSLKTSPSKRPQNGPKTAIKNRWPPCERTAAGTSVFRKNHLKPTHNWWVDRGKPAVATFIFSINFIYP